MLAATVASTGIVVLGRIAFVIALASNDLKGSDLRSAYPYSVPGAITEYSLFVQLICVL